MSATDWPTASVAVAIPEATGGGWWCASGKTKRRKRYKTIPDVEREKSRSREGRDRDRESDRFRERGPIEGKIERGEKEEGFERGQGTIERIACDGDNAL
ncbi:hypothetical protein L6452_09480 [Arctium lappa]|uniref:Uncharacterized protein n=1 Tax=Arctium lappa TaxID=4217 RepID=A0ACB9DKF7_ARCLA|nr:hypothetical protein L6452_09480 [Arctium lappa]